MLLQAVFYINEVRDIGKYLSLVEGDGISSFIFGKKIQLFLHWSIPIDKIYQIFKLYFLYFRRLPVKCSHFQRWGLPNRTENKREGGANKGANNQINYQGARSLYHLWMSIQVSRSKGHNIFAYLEYYDTFLGTVFSRIQIYAPKHSWLIGSIWFIYISNELHVLFRQLKIKNLKVFFQPLQFWWFRNDHSVPLNAPAKSNLGGSLFVFFSQILKSKKMVQPQINELRETLFE